MAFFNDWIAAQQLPEGEKVYLKKDFLGWRVVEPWKRDDGSVNWFNLLLGGKRNLFILGFIMLIAFCGWLAFHEGLENYKTIIENPQVFCNAQQQGLRLPDGSSITPESFNLPIPNGQD